MRAKNAAISFFVVNEWLKLPRICEIKIIFFFYVITMTGIRKTTQHKR